MLLSSWAKGVTGRAGWRIFCHELNGMTLKTSVKSGSTMGLDDIPMQAEFKHVVTDLDKKIVKLYELNEL